VGICRYSHLTNYTIFGTIIATTYRSLLNVCTINGETKKTTWYEVKQQVWLSLSASPSKRTLTIRRGQRNNLPFQEKENKLPLSKN
jgi:hypothetical protein